MYTQHIYTHVNTHTHTHVRTTYMHTCTHAYIHTTNTHTICITRPTNTSHDNPAVAFPTPYRQLHWMYLCFVNCWLLLNPSPLCADWTMATIPPITSLTDPRNLATTVTFGIVATLGFHAINGSERKKKVILVALSLIIFPFIPASNLFFPVGFVVAERILYIPSMGFCMLVSLGLSLLETPKAGLWRSLVRAMLVFVLIVHGLKTVSRNRDWFSDVTLFTSAIRVNPLNGKIHNNLGHEYEQTGDLIRAESLFRRAAELQPDDIGAHINVGRVLKAQEKFKEAEKVRLLPLCAYIYNGLVHAYIYIHANTHVHTRTYTNTHIRMHAHTHVHTHPHTCTHIHTCMHITCTHIHTHTHMCAHNMYTHIHTHTHMRAHNMYTHIHTHVHTCVHITCTHTCTHMYTHTHMCAHNMYTNIHTLPFHRHAGLSHGH